MANARLDEVQRWIDEMSLEIETISSYLREQGVDEDLDSRKLKVKPAKI